MEFVICTVISRESGTLWEPEEKVTCDCEEAHGNALSPVQYRDNTSLTLVAQSTTRKHGLVVRN